MSKIVVIDDDEMYHKIAVAALQEPGTEVTPLPDGESGLEHIARHTPDVVIADIMLPRMSGLDVLNRLKDLVPLVEVIIITGNDDVNLAIDALQKNAFDYLIKPLNVNKLRVTVKRGLQKTAENRQKAESMEELKRSEEKYRTIVHQIPDIIYKIDDEGRFTFISDHIRLLGYEPSELIGTHFHDILHPDDVNEVSRCRILPKFRGKQTGDHKAPKLFDERRTRERRTENLEVRLIRPQDEPTAASADPEMNESIPTHIDASGMHSNEKSSAQLQHKGTFGFMRNITLKMDQNGPKWTEISAAGFRVAKNSRETDINGSIGVIRDISLRKKTEEELLKFKLCIQQTSDIIILTNVDGTISYVNPAFEKTYQYTLEEARQNTPRLIKSGNHTSDFYETMWDKLLHKQEVYLELVNRTRQGRLLYIETSMTPVITEEGFVIGFLAIQRDISKRKETESALRRAKKAAEEATAIKSQFLATMSHEIRTPLNGIIGMTGLLLDTALNAQQQEYARTVYSSGEILLDLINDILDFSKMEAKEMELEDIDFDLRNCLEDVVAMLSERAAHKGLRLILLVRAAVPTYVVGDPGRLKQVLINLVNNAIKFTDDGEVSIHVSVKDTQSPRLLFEVIDTGVGISRQERKELFQPFTQLNNPRNRSGGGTGLGLAISKRLVTAMNGSINLKSRPGRGSNFYFSLPLREAAHPAHTQTAYNELKNMPVLIMTDDDVDRQVLTELLRHYGCAVASGRCDMTGLETLRTMLQETRSPAVIFISCHHGEYAPQTIAQSIREVNECADTPQIIVSDRQLTDNVKAAAADGFQALLNKPFRHNDLLRTMSSVLWPSDPGTTQVADHTVFSAANYTLTPTEHYRVLVAEDNIVNQKVAVQLLSKMGCHCDVAANGQEAVEACKRIRYDMVFMDCQMPVMDGFEATRTIKQLERAPVIVAMTANAMQGDREACIASGMDNYLSKPITSERLYTIIRTYFQPSD